MERIGVIAVMSNVTDINWLWDLWKLLVSFCTAGSRSWMFFNIKLYSGFVTVSAVFMLLIIRSLLKGFSCLWGVHHKPPWALEQAARLSRATLKSPKSIALPAEAIVIY